MSTIEDVTKNPNDYEMRFQWYGGLMCTSNDIKMLRFDLEMKEHYRQENERHDLMIHAMKCYSNSHTPLKGLYARMFLPYLYGSILCTTLLRIISQ